MREKYVYFLKEFESLLRKPEVKVNLSLNKGGAIGKFADCSSPFRTAY